MKAVAEGIETTDQLERLKIMGCELGQGYHFARPLTPEDAIEMLSSSTQLV
jgi:EAL domain-containing protein (putative c-di-GMP-specific phosphodiesterase class I)